MRAILIDPEKQTFTEITITGGDSYLDEAYRLLACQRITTGSRPLLGSLEQGFDTLHVSEDELPDKPSADDPGPRYWFQVDADRNPPSSYALPGRGLVVGSMRKARPAMSASASKN
jgi:hypothetical protein